MDRWRSALGSSSVAGTAGRIIVLLFWTKYAVPRQIKPWILKLTIRRGQSNFSIVFIFVNCEEKGNYRVLSVGQLSFDYRSYWGRSRRMTGESFSGKSSKWECRERRNKSAVTTVFVHTRLWKTKHAQKCNFSKIRQSYVLPTYQIEIHQSQPASIT